MVHLKPSCFDDKQNLLVANTALCPKIVLYSLRLVSSLSGLCCYGSYWLVSHTIASLLCPACS